MSQENRKNMASPRLPLDHSLWEHVQRQIRQYDVAKGELDLSRVPEDGENRRHAIQIDGDDLPWCLWQARSLPGLRRVKLSQNPLSHQGAKALAAADYLPPLRSLYLGGTELNDDGLEKLLVSKLLDSVVELWLPHNRITDPQLVIQACERLLANPVIEGDQPGISVFLNRLKWPEKPGIISLNILQEHDPVKLKEKLLALRTSGKAISAARIVTAGVCGSGKTHLRRRLTEPDASELDAPLTSASSVDGVGTIGTVIRETLLTPDQHGQKLPAVSLTVVDVGGHREQLHAHHNFTYMAGNAAFLLCLHARRTFDGWARHYLEMIQDLARLRYSEQVRTSLRVEDLIDLPNCEKTPVLIVPTFADLPSTSADLSLPATLSTDFPLLNILSVPAVSNLRADCVGAVSRSLGQCLCEMPAVVTMVLGYVSAVRDEVRRLFNRPTMSGRRVRAWISLRKLNLLCDKHGADDVDLVIHELLRLGDVVVPLKDYPSVGEPVSRRIDRLLNPSFVNHYIFRITMDPVARAHRGFMSEERFQSITGDLARPSIRRYLRDLLTQYLVVIPYQDLGREAGFFIPDLFPTRPRGMFEPPDQSQHALQITFKDYVPEHRFFQFLTRCGDRLKPIDEAQGIQLYRDACLITDGNVEARVYADVLQRRFSIITKGPESEAVRTVQRLTQWIEDVVGQPSLSTANPFAEGSSTQRSPKTDADNESKDAEATRQTAVSFIASDTPCLDILEIVYSVKESLNTSKVCKRLSLAPYNWGYTLNPVAERVNTLIDANMLRRVSRFGLVIQPDGTEFLRKRRPKVFSSQARPE